MQAADRSQGGARELNCLICHLSGSPVQSHLHKQGSPPLLYCRDRASLVPRPTERLRGIESVVALLADGLTDRGLEVTLFASLPVPPN
jgi:hypothetical protein